MSLSQIYWLITLPKVSENIGSFLLSVGIIVCVCYGCFWMISGGGIPLIKKILIPALISVVVGGLLLTFIPTTKEIVAIYGINYATNEKSLKEIPPKLFEYANVKLDDLLQESK